MAGCRRAALEDRRPPTTTPAGSRSGSWPTLRCRSRGRRWPSGGPGRSRTRPCRTCAPCCAQNRAGTRTCTAGSSCRPTTTALDLGVLFWHKDGFSTACGHGTIALGVWAVETGRVAAPETGSVDVVDRRPVRAGRPRGCTARTRGWSPSTSSTCPAGWWPSDVPVTTSRGEVSRDRGLRRGDLRDPARRPARPDGHAGSTSATSSRSAARSSGPSTTPSTPCTRPTRG